MVSRVILGVLRRLWPKLEHCSPLLNWLPSWVVRPV
ncbi:hypothetical protein LINPERPRIM_LOCUS21075 [Linum perenne]